MADSDLVALAAELGRVLKQQSLMLALAESCSGGWAAQTATAIPGSSAWFERGFITYSNEAKIEMLGVAPEVLQHHGAVSEEVACVMALGALAHSRAQVAAAITGIAGPAGGTQEKPVGTVCLAWAFSSGAVHATTRHFSGDREAVRRQAVEAALRGLLVYLNN